jgi:hypothetical protein
MDEYGEYLISTQVGYMNYENPDNCTAYKLLDCVNKCFQVPSVPDPSKDHGLQELQEQQVHAHQTTSNVETPQVQHQEHKRIKCSVKKICN